MARENTFKELLQQKPITSLSDILNVLGSTRGGEWQIFRDRQNDFVNTINLGKLCNKRDVKYWKYDRCRPRPFIEEL